MFKGEIPTTFWGGEGEQPLAKNVGELKALLEQLPDELAISKDGVYAGVNLNVYREIEGLTLEVSYSCQYLLGDVYEQLT